MGLPLTGDRSQDALVVVHELEKGFYYLQRENPRKMPEVGYTGPSRPFASAKVRV